MFQLTRFVRFTKKGEMDAYFDAKVVLKPLRSSFFRKRKIRSKGTENIMKHEKKDISNKNPFGDFSM